MGLAGAWIAWFRIPEELVIEGHTVWSADPMPHLISNTIIIPAGSTLMIEPGATVHFRPRASITVRGRLLASGTRDDGIIMTRDPASRQQWAGLVFENTKEKSRLAYLTMEYAGAADCFIHVASATLALDHVTFANAHSAIMRVFDSSLSIQHSIFPAIGENEVIYGARIPAGGHFLIENNTFHPNIGYKDIIDFSHCSRPGPIPVFKGNTFLGGGDDGLDLDYCDAHVVGNTFADFCLNGHEKFANAIALGAKSRVVITNNVFRGNDHAVVCKGGSLAIAVDNTFVSNAFAAFSFTEQKRHTPGGARINRCRFIDNGATFLHEEIATELSISNSVFPEAAAWPAAGNSISPTKGTL